MASTTLEPASSAIAAEIGKDRLLRLYRQMLTVRAFETQAEVSYRLAKIAGFLHLYLGQEAVGAGFLDHLDPGKDFALTSYRCHAHAIFMGVDPQELMAELYGKATGNVRGKGGSMHFFSRKRGLLGGHGIVGGQIPVGTGAAFSIKYRRTGGVCLTFLGDGAVPQGTFHESLNLASLWDLPVVYVVENNRYGMGTACSRAVAVEQIAEAKAPGYRMQGFTVDGLDLYQCWSTAKAAIAIARAGRPVLVEAKTYRYRGHSVSDKGAYRTKAEIDMVRAHDPIDRVKTDLIARRWADEASLEAMNEEVQLRIQDCVRFAEESPLPAPEDLARHVFAEP